MTKIYLSPSDQTNNAYAYGNTNEAVQCRKIADACEVALKRCGFEVKNNKTSSMYDRVAESNNWGADLHIPIHTNAYNGSVTGTRVFAWDTSAKGYKVAKAVYDVLAPLTIGTSDNLSTNQEWYEMKKANAPTVYIECEFHDNAESAKWIVEHTKEIGEAIAKGVCNYYGVAFVEEATPDVLYRVQVGAYSVKSNADAMLAKLKSAGFDGFITTVKK